MRDCLVIAVRSLAVLALVVGLPLLALPPVRASLGDWVDEVLQDKWLDLQLPTIASGDRDATDGQPSDHERICWQAGLGADFPADASPPEPAMTGDNLASPAFEDPQISELRRHLIERGAQYMRLDEVAGQPAAYHFSCLMPVGSHAVYSRQFAITDADPIRAMQRVLDEVERWQDAQASL